jgi:hypothetical protein
MHVSRCSTVAHKWSMLADLYSSQTQARVINTRIALTTTKKNQLTVSDYYAKMCHFADELATSGAPLCDDELVAYLLAGLNEDSNPVFTAMVARVNPITPSELYAQLLSFEHHTNLQTHTSSGGSSSAMAASRNRGFSGGHGQNGLSRGNDHGPSRGGFSKISGTNNTVPRHALNANSVSGLVIRARLACTNMKKMPLLISAMQPLLLPPTTTTSGTLTLAPLIISLVTSTG